MLRKLIGAVVGLAMMCMAGTAKAVLIYDNGVSLTTGGANFSQVGSTTLYDNFSIGSPDTVRSIQFWGTHWISGIIPADDSFTLSIYGDTAGSVNTGNIIGTSSLNLVTRIDTGFNHNNILSGGDIYEYTMDLPNPFVLLSGVQYWFSVVHSAVPGNTTRFGA